jgi:hypothetical protein
MNLGLKPRSAGFQTCCVAGFQTRTRFTNSDLPTWKSATQQTWKSALRDTTSPLAILTLLLFSRLIASGANVTVNTATTLFTVASNAYGIHTSVYDNQNGSGTLPTRLIESGVNTLRYSGGGYADVYHWSVHKLSPWQDGSYGYIGPNTDFGHFVQLLDSAQANAVITINFGSGQLWNAGHTSLIAPTTNAEPQEAAAWVAYANGSAALYGSTNDIAIGTDSLGNNWRTVGFWARLRSSTAAQYQTWATADGVYDATFNFLAINHSTPVGIKYWEIGNETFGTGFYSGDNGYSVNYAVPYPSTTFPRQYNPALSPTTYGQQVRLFSLAMKAVDPTIKIGAVVSTPPDDYSWDVDNLGQHWIPQVLQGCATNIDFVIAHWYPFAGNNANGSSLMAQVASKIPPMIDGVAPHTGTSSGLRDWINAYRPTDATNVQIVITEFAYNGSVTNNNTQGPVNALFAADSYASWMRRGVANIDWLEMNKTTFLGDGASLSRGAVYYAVQLLNRMARGGDALVQTTSDTSTLKAHSALRTDGKFGLTLINESLVSTQTVNITVNGATLSTNGTRYQFGATNFTTASMVPSSAPSSNSVSGLGNSFAVSVPPLTMVVLSIPTVITQPPPATPIGLAAIAGDGQVQLSWSASSGATAYYLKRSEISGGAYASIATNVDVSFNDMTVSNGFAYFYVVSAANAIGESTNSLEVNANPVSRAPTDISVAFIEGQLQLAWPQDHTGWILQAQTNSPDDGLGSVWTTIPSSTVTNVYAVPVNTADGSVFFRLMAP